jgi:hypothetical protein
MRTGGGIYSALQNSNFRLSHTDVAGNSALTAGAVYIGESHEWVRLEDVNIIENIALETAGGAYFAQFNSEVILSDCQIRNNSAGSVGGLLVQVDSQL